MVRIHVREVPDSVSTKLSEQATQLGYSSRDDYLRDVLEKVATDEMIYHSDARYEIAMENLAKQVQTFGDILYLNVRLGMLQSPFEFDQEGNVVRRKTFAEIVAEGKNGGNRVD
ncbi:hypothetical protein KNP65_03725 [Latilactobacillus curvatus]|uniref:hypothetical protein n=1 Tax=Latilactobacillus curvatus TaxID=28038 RepID=UPI002411463D|nr:hypothetical protein [Latilactobacillus curvatus]MDG2979047.1 hypothetical protein [Latilactobacillus curvatus]